MADFENHNLPNTSRSGTGERSHPTLESGLAALKQKNYEVAIADLTQVEKTAKQRSTKLKAQMGLVNAYERTGKVQQALAKCDALATSKSAQVQRWANQKLASLRQRHPHLKFDAPGAETAVPAQATQSDLQNSDLQNDFTGFQPFEGEPPPTDSAPYSDAGFVPLHSKSEGSKAGMSDAASPERVSSDSRESSAAPVEGASETSSASGFENPFASLDDLAVSPSGERSLEAPNPLPNANQNSTASSAPPSPTESKPTRRTTGLPRGTTAAQRTPKRPVNLPSERARQWKPLKASRSIEFWLSYGWLAIALVILLTLLIRIALATAYPVWEWLENFNFIPVPRIFVLEDHPARVVVVGLLGLMVVSPWVMQWVLGQFYGVTSLSERELERRSPETVRLLKRVSTKEHFPVPALHLLPTDAPMILSYGHLPRTAHIVMSRGLLTQLSDDELACLCATELGHIRQKDLIPMTLAVLVQQIPFLLYWGVAQWGDRQTNGALRAIASGVSAAAYGIFWLLRLPALWLSRTRQLQGDRHAASMTGNPNGQTRALLNLAVGMAQTIERQRLADASLEGLENLMPVSYRQALTVGSLHTKQQLLYRDALQSESDANSQPENSQSEALSIAPTITLQPFLAWGAQNPYRRWLTVNNTHPPLGDRLYHLAQYALQWRIRPDLELSARPSSKEKTKPFWLQVIPYASPMLGLGAAVVLWLAGGIARAANVDAIEWLWGDRSLLWGCVAIGFSFGTLIRINHFFPDITASNARSEEALPELLESAHLTPVDSIPVRWTGKVLGRDPIANGLNQDLILRTSHGSIKLHFLSALGPLGNLVLGSAKPADFVGKTVTVTGWFRRGATPWIDVETLKPERRPAIRSGHPLWSTLLAIATTLWGAYVIYRGSF